MGSYVHIRDVNCRVAGLQPALLYFCYSALYRQGPRPALLCSAHGALLYSAVCRQTNFTLTNFTLQCCTTRSTLLCTAWHVEWLECRGLTLAPPDLAGLAPGFLPAPRKSASGAALSSGSPHLGPRS